MQPLAGENDTKTCDFDRTFTWIRSGILTGTPPIGSTRSVVGLFEHSLRQRLVRVGSL